MIRLARDVGLEVSLASYSMLEVLLMKARARSGGQLVTSRYLAGSSPFLSVGGSKMDDSVASGSNYSLPTITETEASDIVASSNVLQESCSSKQANVCLVEGKQEVRSMRLTVSKHSSK